MRCKTLVPVAIAAGFFLSAARADTTLEPRPAEIMPKATEWILNDITRAGEHYLAVGDRGHILRSADGQQWSQIPAPVQAMLIRARFVDDRHGWTVGHDGVVLATGDGGASWRIIHRDAELGKPIYDALLVDRDTGYIVGGNAVFKKTQDGGQSWETLEPDLTIHGLNIYNILALADGTLVISGEKGTLARSLDGGESWQQLKTPYAGSFFGMLPYGEAGVFLFGLRGNVYAAPELRALAAQDSFEWDEFSLESETDNAVLAEQGWRYYPNPLKESLFGGVNLDPQNVLLVGVNGAVVRTRGGAMQPLKTGIEHTLGDALISGRRLLTVGFMGIEAVPFDE